MMLSRVFAVLGLCWGLCAPASAFDLQDAWQAALGYDAHHSAANHQRLAAAEQAQQGLAPLLPQVSLNAQYQRHLPIDPDLPAYNQHGYNVQATQALFDAGKWADYRQGQVGAKLANVQFDLNEQQLLLQVSQAYFDVLTAHDVIEATAASKTLYQRQLDQAKTMFDVGAATIVDTHEAQAGWDNAHVQWLNAQHQLALSQQSLQHLTGLDPTLIQRMQGEQVAHIVPVQDLAQWQQWAQQHNTELASKTLALEQAQVANRKARAQRYPTVQLQAAYQDQHQEANALSMGQASDNRAASIGVQLNMPLYTGGGISSQIRQAEYEVLQRQDEWLAAKRDVDLKVKEQFLNVQSGRAQIKALEQLVLTNAKKLESSQLGQQVGVRSNLDVVMAQQAYADSQQQLAQARYGYLQSQLALSQAAGTLQQHDTLANINQAIGVQTLRKQP